MSNFSYLCNFINKEQYANLYAIARRGVRAEECFIEHDYNSCLIVCRQVVESLFSWIATSFKIALEENGQKRRLFDIIDDVSDNLGLSPYYQRILHNVRMLGNEAVHDYAINDVHRATEGLQSAYQIFHLLFALRYAPRHFQPKEFTIPTSEKTEITNLLKSKAIESNNPSSADQAQASHYLKEAREAQRKRDYQTYETLLEQALKHHSKQPEVLYRLAMHYQHSDNNDKKDQVKPLLERAIEYKHPHAPARLAEILIEENPSTEEEYQKIWQLLTQAIQHNDTSKNKKDNHVYMVCARIYEEGLLGKAKDLSKAIDYVKQAQEHNHPQAGEYLSKLQDQLATQPTKAQSTVDTTLNNTVANTMTNTENSTPQPQNNKDWQWWVSLDDRWRELLITKGLNISPDRLDLLSEQRMKSYVRRILRLEKLDLEDCSIDDVEPLANLTALRLLDLGNNNISNLTPLAKLTRLEGLLLKGNEISDLTPLAKLRWLAALVLERNDIYDIQPLANLTALRILDLDGNTVDNIESLKDLIWLEELHLKQNRISDITPLANLRRLKTLNLDGNGVDNIKPLEDLTQIERLDLDSNNIDNIEPLANLTRLKVLFLRRNNISDIAVLANLTQLNKMSLSDNMVENIQPLANLLRLETLHLKNNNISDITPLTKLIRLKILTMENNAFEDILPLVKLTQLEELDLDNCDNITDITPLIRLTKLTKLLLRGIGISDITPLANLKRLKQLDLRRNNISDITPLTKLSELRRDDIELAGNPIDPQELDDFLQTLKH